jgi:hypothetical protein
MTIQFNVLVALDNSEQHDESNLKMNDAVMA